MKKIVKLIGVLTVIAMILSCSLVLFSCNRDPFTYKNETDSEGRVIWEKLVHKKTKEVFEHTFGYDNEGRCVLIRYDYPEGTSETRLEYSADGKIVKETTTRSSSDVGYYGLCKDPVLSTLNGFYSDFTYYYQYYQMGFITDEQWNSLEQSLWSEVMFESSVDTMSKLRTGYFEGFSEDLGSWFAYFSDDQEDIDEVYQEYKVSPRNREIQISANIPKIVTIGDDPQVVSSESVLVSSDALETHSEYVVSVSSDGLTADSITIQHLPAGSYALPYTVSYSGPVTAQIPDDYPDYTIKVTGFDRNWKTITHTYDGTGRIACDRMDRSDGSWGTTAKTFFENGVTYTERRESSEGDMSEETYDEEGRMITCKTVYSDGRKEDRSIVYGEDGSTETVRRERSEDAWSETVLSLDQAGNKLSVLSREISDAGVGDEWLEMES